MKSKTTKIEALEKATSYISGFDEILNGGLPEGRTTLIEGGPGTGKSILALEFLYRGALHGQAGIFVAFEERATAVRRNALTLGWDLAALEKTGKLLIIEATMDPATVVSGDFNIKALLAIIEGQAKAINAQRIVFDALDVLFRLFDDPSQERSELYALHEWLLDHKMTAILTIKATETNNVFTRYEFIEYMVDCVIRVIQRPGEWVSTRELQVIKFRGSDFGRNAYPFVIQPGGVSVIPISEVCLQHQSLGPYCSSGSVQLDKVLGGGYRQGSSVLVAGAAGTGKSTLAATFIKAACERREKVLLLGFEESQEAIVQNMLSPGIDLRPAIEKGYLEIATAMPESQGTEKHLIRTFTLIDDFKPAHVVVDAISAFERMGSIRAAFEFAMRLISRCKGKGITVILLSQSRGGSEDRHFISGLGISSFIDAIVWLRFIDFGNQIKRVLLVIKSRGSKHSSQYHDFRITDQGVKLLKDSAAIEKVNRRALK